MLFQVQNLQQKKKVSTFLKKMREIRESTAHFNETPVIVYNLTIFKSFVHVKNKREQRGFLKKRVKTATSFSLLRALSW